MQLTIALISAAIIFGALDAIWLSWAGPNFYRPAIGEVMADDFRLAPALVFYALYLAGMGWFVIAPAVAAQDVSAALLNGAALGGLAYATYDLTSQAVLKVWSTKVSLADIAWGAFATGATSALSTFIAVRFFG
ncbi:DUF2177 family protein [Erythrobacter sp. SCSIO 43205]|uniref:DUF2177 family protein n=1 Tax=Erythrobacter sp. SCSIO 43205 TaxID=2779361 RepID=UPI001CAA401F|nr:DUF2177 family protein [Erythrobacter sp. SCSIO 43205]UAB78392.1 DUF2177 family protein [Erythrobacter sp. SCSIO 43205]